MDRGDGAPETLTSLLSVELAAVETYRVALARAGDSAARVELRRICGDHSRAVQVLRALLLRLGDDAPGSTGARDGFVDDGDGELAALRAGEARQVEAYRQALSDPGLTSAVKALIRSDLLRRSENHVPVLEALLADR